MTEFDTPSRRELLAAIGKAGGAIALYQAMTALGHAAPTQFSGPPKLTGAKTGASVIILGSGLAGMVAAYEMTKAGYKVQVLEYQDRPGGRNYTVRGGDVIKEVGGAVQQVKFAPGNYLNPGPWRIPFHHQALLHYCEELGVALEPFIQVNMNGYIHSDKVYGGKPQRIAEVGVDFKGHVRRAARQGREQGRARRHDHQGGQGKAARGDARLGPAQQGHGLYDQPADLRPARL